MTILSEDIDTFGMPIEEFTEIDGEKYNIQQKWAHNGSKQILQVMIYPRQKDNKDMSKPMAHSSYYIDGKKIVKKIFTKSDDKKLDKVMQKYAEQTVKKMI